MFVVVLVLYSSNQYADRFASYHHSASDFDFQVITVSRKRFCFHLFLTCYSTMRSGQALVLKEKDSMI